MPYRIRSRTKRIADQLGVMIKPSDNPEKKLDVFIPMDDKKFKKISIGARHYADFHIYKELELVGKVPEGTANARKIAYEKRHHKDLIKKGSPGYYAYKLLWT